MQFTFVYIFVIVTFLWMSALEVVGPAVNLHACIAKLFPCSSNFTMLVQDAGIEIDYLDHLNAEVERKLGQLVLEK